MFMMLRAVPTVGGERGLPFLPGHCRCHTEKEDKRMSISAQIESCFCYCYRKKKSKTSKGNRKHCVWAGKFLQVKCCEEK